ncbi:hypothetical protein NE565_24115 [Phocaeicola vulgatus]|nr:hypothetical protein [Phocaeicola vulgatus]
MLIIMDVFLQKMRIKKGRKALYVCATAMASTSAV